MLYLNEIQTRKKMPFPQNIGKFPQNIGKFPQNIGIWFYGYMVLWFYGLPYKSRSKFHQIIGYFHYLFLSCIRMVLQQNFATFAVSVLPWLAVLYGNGGCALWWRSPFFRTAVVEVSARLLRTSTARGGLAVFFVMASPLPYVAVPVLLACRCCAGRLAVVPFQQFVVVRFFEHGF